jgi:hypothetical protein
MTTDTMPRTSEEVIEALATSPTVEDLERATRVSLSDLLRLGAQESNQVRAWGSGENACALSAAGLGLAALRRH